MADAQKPPASDAKARLELGPYGPRGSEGLSTGEGAALIAALVWLAGSALFFILLGDGDTDFDPLRFVMVLLAVFLPVALIWIGCVSARAARTMRAESRRLHAAIDALRKDAQAVASGVPGGAAPAADLGKRLDRIDAAQRKTELTLAKFISVRGGEAPSPAADLPPISDEAASGGAEQPSLALDGPAAPGAPLPMSDFISALQFPADATDREGFRALRKALSDRRTAGLVTAAQDVLTLLSQDGIYTDDLAPDRAHPDLWRRFARGERGRAVAALGGVRDRSSLALAGNRMRQDMVFRDAAHHFLRVFDRVFAELEQHMTDAEIGALSDTRTARAFILLGRVTGTFD